jgi:hypothetical protein
MTPLTLSIASRIAMLMASLSGSVAERHAPRPSDKNDRNIRSL